MEPMDLKATLEWTEALAREAVDRALSMKRSDFHVREKSDGTLVTDIDGAIERFLRDAITERFPEHAIMGEEFGKVVSEGSRGRPLWALDPIDGTTNMAHGLPQWAICIGLVADDQPQVGVVASPEMGETFSAARGLGAFRNGVPLPGVAAGGPLAAEDAYGVCTTSIHRVSFDRFPARLRILGAAALDYCWAAAGRLAGAQSIGVELYDVAAALCLVNEVGAETRWLRTGEVFSPNRLATAGSVHDDVLISAPAATLAYLRDVLTMKAGPA